VSRPLVALVGRPNVGKSTLFNRLAGRRAAIVEDVPGVTRDRHYADLEWDGRALTVVDTGGFEPRSRDPLVAVVERQAQLAVDEAAVIILVVDGREGLTAVDQAVADLLRRAGKPLFVAVNKIDSAKAEAEAPLAEFHRLGFGEIHAISSEHGRGVGDLLDAVLDASPAAAPAISPAPRQERPSARSSPTRGKSLAEENSDDEAAALAEAVGEQADAAGRDIRLAIVGRPNVGKSTFVNALLGEERFIVSEVAGTTRDAIDTVLEDRGCRFVITDTAGIRRKRSIAQRVEAYSVVRALRAVDEAEVVACLLDAGEAGVEQDARLLGMIAEKGKALVRVVNKWDLAEGAGATQAWYRGELERRLPFVSWAPLIFASGLTGKGVAKVLHTAARLVEQHRARLPTRALNDLLEEIQAAHPAPLARGRPVKLYYVAQVAYAPLTFVIQCNRPEAIPLGYRRYVENRFRDAFGLQVPMRMVYRERKRRERGRSPAPR
jgi:GTP-binding protein